MDQGSAKYYSNQMNSQLIVEKVENIGQELPLASYEFTIFPYLYEVGASSGRGTIHKWDRQFSNVTPNWIDHFNQMVNTIVIW